MGKAFHGEKQRCTRRDHAPLAVAKGGVGERHTAKGDVIPGRVAAFQGPRVTVVHGPPVQLLGCFGRARV